MKAVALSEPFFCGSIFVILAVIVMFALDFLERPRNLAEQTVLARFPELIEIPGGVEEHDRAAAGFPDVVGMAREPIDERSGRVRVPVVVNELREVDLAQFLAAVRGLAEPPDLLHPLVSVHRSSP